MPGLIAGTKWLFNAFSGLGVAWIGLTGVLVGLWMAGRHQRIERQNARRREQLMGFYAPLRGMREEIEAKSELRVKLHRAGNNSWQARVGRVRDHPEALKQIQKEEWPKYEAIIDYSDEQVRKELVPTYRRMLDHFTANMGLAEPSTLQHYKAFVEFVEVWERWLKDSIPGDVVEGIAHSEASVKPFYDDITRNFDELFGKLKK